MDFLIETGLELDPRLIKNIQIVPRTKEFELHIVYEKLQVETRIIENKRVVALEPNSSNFFAIVIEEVSEPYLIGSKGLKSLLRKYYINNFLLTIITTKKLKKQREFMLQNYPTPYSIPFQ